MNTDQPCSTVAGISQVLAQGEDADARIDAATLTAAHRRELRSDDPNMRVALLTGGQDPHYAYGLATALASQGVDMEVLGGESIDGSHLQQTSGLHFDLVYGGDGDRSRAAKIKKVLGTYARLIRYAAVSNRKVLHILWNYKLEPFDRTFLLLFYKLLNKKIVLTAHNVNAARRDLKDSLLNRFTLRVQYRLADHIFVHTAQMKDELKQQFGVRDQNITIIPYGVNNAVPNSSLTRAEARRQLGIDPSSKVLLFFGAIKAYKGLEYLVSAFHELSGRDCSYRLIIAGEEKKAMKGTGVRSKAPLPIMLPERRSYRRSLSFLTRKPKCISRRQMSRSCPTLRFSRAEFCFLPTVLGCL